MKPTCLCPCWDRYRSRPASSGCGRSCPRCRLRASKGLPGMAPQRTFRPPGTKRGYTGQGVKVGVIDVGFGGFSDLIGTELPEPAGVMCFTDMGKFTQDLTDCEAARDGEIHGTAVVESLVDIAPQVDLYIGRPVSPGDLQAIADWMVSEGVSVINHSVVWPFDGPGDGTSPHGHSPLRTVDRAVVGGVVWVNSAGNAAESTWFKSGSSLTLVSDGLVEFAPLDIFNCFVIYPWNEPYSPIALG